MPPKVGMVTMMVVLIPAACMICYHYYVRWPPPEYRYFSRCWRRKKYFQEYFWVCGIVPRQYKFLLQLKQEICYCFYCFYFLGNASTIVSEAVKWGTRKGRILALWSLLLPWEIQIQAAGCAGDPFTWCSIAVWELLQKQYRALLLLLNFGFVSPKRS